MTRQRAPLSLDAAIGRIMAQLGGWNEVARVTGKAPRTCEKWGAFDIADADDPDARDIPMRAAVKLTIAYQAAGGVDDPIGQAYADQVRIAASEAFGDKQELRRESIGFLRETSEANLALLEATEPDAGADEEAIATKQVLDVRNWADRILLRLAGRQRKPP